MGTHATKVTKNLSNKYGQKLIDSGNKIGDKITSVSKKSAKNYKMMNLVMKQRHQKKDTYIPKKGNKLLKS